MRASNLFFAALTIGIAATAHTQDLVDNTRAVQLSNPGKHMGESIHLQVSNLGDAPRTFTLPAGWVFDSMDEGAQNLLLERAVELEVPAGTTVSAVCEAYCVEPNKKGPHSASAYSLGYMGGASTTELARFIDAHRFRGQSAVLFAVWATLGERPVDKIQSDYAGETELLQAKVRELIGAPVPEQLFSEVY